MNRLSRRAFLTGTILAGIRGLGRARAQGLCAPTESNPQGPFYLPGAPFRDRLAPEGEPGDTLTLRGRVLQTPGCTPLRDAVVDVWHASAEGFYYGLETGDPGEAWDFPLRGRARSDAEGAFAFHTVVPGRYRMSTTHYRPRHVHVVASHPGAVSLTTQIYFEGDPFLRRDPLVIPSLVIPLSGRSRGKGMHFDGSFDIVLRGL